jgi:hypothetical protein
MLQGARPVGCCPKVLKRVLLIGFFAYKDFYYSILVPGSSFLGPRFWTFSSWTSVLGVVGRYAADSCLYWSRIASGGARCFKGFSGGS